MRYTHIQHTIPTASIRTTGGAYDTYIRACRWCRARAGSRGLRLPPCLPAHLTVEHRVLFPQSLHLHHHQHHHHQPSTFTLLPPLPFPSASLPVTHLPTCLISSSTCPPSRWHGPPPTVSSPLPPPSAPIRAASSLAMTHLLKLLAVRDDGSIDLHPVTARGGGGGIGRCSTPLQQQHHVTPAPRSSSYL